MSANSRVFLKPFIGGLNTEGSDTDDMVLNTSDELNCTILPEQMRGRRYGFNIEKDGQWIDSNEESIVAHSLYHWNNVYENVNYVVVQINDKLYIYPDTKPHSQQTPLTTIDLSQYATLSLIEPVSMTSVSSSLFVVSRWIQPIVIEKEPDSLTFTVSVNNPKFRDFNGVEDGYAVDYSPTTLSNRHKYNLMNQGWDKTIYDASSQTYKSLLPDTTPGGTYQGLFYTQYASTHSGVGAYPANNMQWFIGKQNSGSYNTTDLLNTYFGNTPAPKGHYIIDYLNRNRSMASGITVDDEPAQPGVNYDATIPVNNSEGYTQAELAGRLYFGYSLPEAYVTIPNDYKITYALPVVVSGILTKFSWGLKDYCKKTGVYGVVSPNPDDVVDNAYRSDSHISDLYIFSQPFTISLIGVTGTGTEVVVYSDVIQLTGKMYTAAGWDFSVSNTTSYTRYEIRITWPDLDRSHKWLIPDTVIETLVIDEINYDEQTEESYEGLPSSDLLRGAITDIESFGGRLFYLCGNTVLFSQTLSTNNKNFDKCYQEADPTSEEISDIVATDGGMIQLLSLGRGKALKSFYRGVLVFGDEEVTGILSNSINLFSADSYDVVKITSAGLTSKYSIVETDSNILYWSNHGIFIVGIDENNNISSNCISINTIQNWYNNLSQFSRDNCVGYYDYANNRVYWFYPTTNVADKLDGCLVYDLTFNTFMPQYIDSGKVVRDIQGNFAGILNSYNSYVTRSGKVYKCYVDGNSVYDLENNLMGYTQNTYLTDCQESSTVYEIEPTVYLRAGGNRVVAGQYKVLATPRQDAGFNRKSAGLFLISDGTKFSFGDFNDREFRDWDTSPYNSYMVSRPITLGDTFFNKQTPVMQTLFKRTEEYKLNKAPEVVTHYEIDPIYIGGELRLPEIFTRVYNTGIFKYAYAILDLSSMQTTSGRITFNVYGRDPETHMEYTIGTTNKRNVAPSSRVVLHIPAASEEYADKEFKEFRLDVIINGTFFNLYDLDAKFYFGLDRTDMTEQQFKGFKTVSSTGQAELLNNQYFPNIWRADIPSDGNVIKDISVKFVPFFGNVPVQPEDPIEVAWTGQGVFAYRGTQIVSKGISDTDDTLTYDNYSQPVGYTEYQLGFNLATVDPSYAEASQVFAEYTINTYVAEYGETLTYTPSDYTTPSGATIRMRWGWSVDPLSNRWDMMQNGYRPQKDFLHDDYVESRMHIRGRGKAFQVEIRNDENKDFRLTGLNIITRSPQ